MIYLLLMLLASTLAVACLLLRSERGWQDENGFHYGTSEDDLERSDEHKD